jgi:large subunit ribosomal protein L13
MKTYIPKENEIQRQWFLIDAKGRTLGRLASKIAHVLMGKHKIIYTPFLDVGDYVIVTNARYIRTTGAKLEEKIYFHYSGYPGGLKKRTLAEMLEKHPEKVIEQAVRLMLPKNALGRKMLKKLRVYPEGEHPHVAQNPQTLD